MRSVAGAVNTWRRTYARRGICLDIRAMTAAASAHTRAGMRTTVSIPDALFAEAERLAIERGMTRSELYSHAVAQLVSSARALGVRERLDSVYAADPRVSELEPAVQTLQEQSLERKW